MQGCCQSPQIDAATAHERPSEPQRPVAFASSGCGTSRTLESAEAGHLSVPGRKGPHGTPLKLQGDVAPASCSARAYDSCTKVEAAPADFLYAAVPGLRLTLAQPEPSAAAQTVLQDSLRFFDEQDSLAKALLQKKPVYRVAMQAQNGPDLTSPDRNYHFLAPAAPNAPPHWSGEYKA